MQAILAASLPDRLLRGQPPALSLLTWGRTQPQDPEPRLLRERSDMRNFPSTLQEIFLQK